MGNVPGSTMRVYPDAEIAGYASKAGFTGEDLVIAVAVTHPESGATMKRGAPNGDGTYDHGLWQINDVHRPSDLVRTDPQANAQAAYKVFKSQGWGAWSAYRNNLHLPFMDKARVAAKNPGPTKGSLQDIPDAVKSVVPGILDPLASQLNKIAGNLTTILLALVLLVIGILLANGKTLIGAGATVAGAVVNPVGTGVKAVTKVAK